MANQEISQADLHRLRDIGAEGYEAKRIDAEKRLGIAIWNIVDLEIPITEPHRQPQESISDYYDVIYGPEIQVTPQMSIEIEFRATTGLLDLAKSDWLTGIRSTALRLNTFEHEFPHTDDPINRSTLLIRPRNYKHDRPELHRSAPHVLQTEVPEMATLTVPDIETTLLILDKIAAEYN